MEYQKSIIELIRTRTSSRTFEDREPEAATLQQFADYFAQISQTAGIRCRFVIARPSTTDAGKPVKFGTYGIISGSCPYIVAIMDKTENDALAMGYLFEKIILFATDLGLQTCWMGGTFKKSDFEQSVQLAENEFIPLVSPVGYKKQRPRIFESAMRAAISANKRKPWSELFFDADGTTPLDEQRATSYAIPLEMVRLGPSASNKQPWRIIRGVSTYHLFLCRTKGYGVPNYDIQMNDMGIAQCHFEMAALETGLEGCWQAIPDIHVPEGWEYVTTWVPGETPG